MSFFEDLRRCNIGKVSNLTLGELLNECATRHGARPFVTVAETENTVSYDQFEALGKPEKGKLTAL